MAKAERIKISVVEDHSNAAIIRVNDQLSDFFVCHDEDEVDKKFKRLDSQCAGLEAWQEIRRSKEEATSIVSKFRIRKPELEAACLCLNVSGTNQLVSLKTYLSGLEEFCLGAYKMGVNPLPFLRKKFNDTTVEFSEYNSRLKPFYCEPTITVCLHENDIGEPECVYVVFSYKQFDVQLYEVERHIAAHILRCRLKQAPE